MATIEEKRIMKHIEKYFSVIAIILLVSLFLTSSCSKDKIEDLCAEEYLGEIYLLESSRNSIPYNENTSLYFQDSLGNETIFQIDMEYYGYKIRNFSHIQTCEYDNSLEKKYKVHKDKYSYVIKESAQTLNKRFLLRLETEPFYDPFSPVSYDTIYDRLAVFIASKTDSTSYYSNLRILVNPRNLSENDIDDFIDPVEEITLLNKTFYSVFISKISKEYYNYEYGLIAFRDWDNKLWVLDKTEKNIK